MNSTFKKVFIATLVFTALSSSFADFWKSITPYRGPKKDIITLIITANYKHPLIIAQLIQDEIKQPYILLPASNGKGIFFNPPRKRSEAALEIREANLKRFISFLNPKQIVILGDKRYVTDKYREMIAKDIPVITFSGNNWQRIADRLSILLDAHNVGDDYKELGQQIDSNLYKPKKTKASAPSDAPAEDIVIDNIIVDKKEAKTETAVTEKTMIKEPEAVMPKDAPKLIINK